MTKDVNNMSFLDHLEDLRWHLIRICIAIVLCGIVAFIFKGFMFSVIFAPTKMNFPTYKLLCHISHLAGVENSDFCAKELPFIIQSRKFAGQFSAHIWTSIYAGFIIAFPYVIYQFWKFISPGMKKNERKHTSGFIVISSVLFFVGVLFGYYILNPLTINFLGTYSVGAEISNEFDLSDVIGLVRTSAIASGFIFELPIIIYFLTKVGIVTPQILKKYRKFALVIVLIL